jgi:hypothetical protein
MLSQYRYLAFHSARQSGLQGSHRKGKERRGVCAALCTAGALSRSKGRREKRRRCVWFAGGSAILAEGLCSTEGDLQESTSGGDGTRNRVNLYAKATMGLMKETQSNPNRVQQPSARGACKGNRRRARGAHTMAKQRRKSDHRACSSHPKYQEIVD